MHLDRLRSLVAKDFQYRGWKIHIRIVWYEIIGIYKSDEDFKKYPAMPGTQIGDYIIKNQNDDNVINTKDKKSFGSPLPKVVLGWNNTFRYKSFELTLDLYSELGKKLIAQH